MAEEAKSEAEEGAGEGSEALESGSYEVIRARLVAQGRELKERAGTLNERRKETFGGTELTVVANERVRTIHNCLPADIAQVGGHLLFGYNVFFGLKKEPAVEDVFSIHAYGGGEGEGPAFAPLSNDAIPGLLASPDFIKDFTDLYRYYRGTRLLRLKTTDTKLLAVFQIGEAVGDVKVFHWNALPGGGYRYVDSRGEREYTMPRAYDFEWVETTREDQVAGEHPHISILDEVFVETIGGDLTIKIEDNTADGLGIYREPVDDANQALDDAKILYARLGSLILIKVLPYRESAWRHFVFNTRTHEVARIDAIGQACVSLPEDHGFVFPGGYYLQSGESKRFGGDISGLEFERRIDAPNGEDVLYIFHRRDEGRYVLLPYNLIRKEMQNPIVCHGYSLFRDGKMAVFRLVGEEATAIHPMQIWQTPFCSIEHAAAAPTDDSYLSKVGNAELVRGISEVYSVVRLIENQSPRRETYTDLIDAATRLLDNYYWISNPEAGDLAAVLKSIRETGELIIDEFEKVQAIRRRAREAVADAEAKQAALCRRLRPEEWKGVDAFMDALTSIRNQRGAVITLRDLRSVDLAALDRLEAELVAEFERISQATITFLGTGEALAPIAGELDAVLGAVQAVDNATNLAPHEAEITRVGDGLAVLAEVVSGLQAGDAVARTAILEKISEVMAHHGRVRATYQSVRRNLLTREGKAEFAAQFKLFAQTVQSALALCDSPERCDEQLTAVLVQLEELEGRFSEFDEFLADLTAKREEVNDAFSGRKQTLLDERQARVQNLIGAAERILEGIARRARSFAGADELNAYFAADPMVLKVRELVSRIGELGASVKADEIAGRVKAARQDALRALRDRLDLYEEGARVIKLGRHRFSVNTQPVELTLVAQGEKMALHLSGTDFFEVIEDPDFDATRAYWGQQIVSESEAVYRGEYLAAEILSAAEAGAGGLSLASLHDAERGEGGLVALCRRFAAERYDEGYERGLHDGDAAQILEKVLALRSTGGLLRFVPRARSLACLFWAFCDEREARATWQRRAQSLARVRELFGQGAGLAALAGELAAAIGTFLEGQGIPTSEGDRVQAGAYLVEELSAERPRFATAAGAEALRDALWRALDAAGKRRLLEDDLRALEGRLRERLELVRAWLEAVVAGGQGGEGAEHFVDEAAVLFVTDRRLERASSGALSALTLTGLLGQHPRIREGSMELRLDEFLARLGEFQRVRVPGFRAYRQLRQRLIERERRRLRLDELMPRVLTSFVRNKLISEVYLPLIGDNLAKQLGSVGEGKRTDQMGMLLLISPPGYGKTTLMEYIASRLGLVFIKVNGPALGHSVVSLDPAEAPNATAAQEVEKINLGLEMGNNVMLYLDDIQHTNPELLQKFISLCDGQRRIEGVWRGKTRTYDLRGKKFCVVMAGNPYTESGGLFKIPDMLANRADTYNLGDILGGYAEAFALSYVENALTSNPTLAPLSARDQQDVYRFARMARGEEVPSGEFGHDYSAAEVQEILAVLRHLFRCRDVLLKVNQLYIVSAAMDDAFRVEPPFKLQGSYRNMNKLAEKIASAMTPDEVEAVIDDHYQGEAQTLTTDAEQNLLKLAELRGRLRPEQQGRWQHIKKEFQRTRSLGGAEDDPVVRVTSQLSLLGERLGAIGDAVRGAAQGRGDPASMYTEVAKALQATAKGGGGDVDWMRPYVAQMTNHLKEMKDTRLQVQVRNEAPPGVTELLAQQVAIVERTLIPLVRAATGNLADVRGLEAKVDGLLAALHEIDMRLRLGR
ncbi:MAG: DNA repair ATPase [Myxococcales bacterium]|nr:DNA repair ATPase [Myxococcales bacterium]